MSKKKKKTMGNIEIKDAKDLEQTENTEQDEEILEESETAAEDEVDQEEPEMKEPDPEPEPQTEEPQEEAADESGEDQEEAVQDDEDLEDRPKKKERKLKWAKAAEKGIKEFEEAAQAKLAEANDRYARLFAEFDNFRKRSEKEKAQRYDYGAKDMIERILPVIDNFERGLASASQEGREEDSFVKGMEMTYKQLMKVLEDAGVKPIEAVGQEFNPEFHNAVMHVDDPEAGENVIIEEFQKGYMYKDHVVRYSMVKVAN